MSKDKVKKDLEHINITGPEHVIKPIGSEVVAVSGMTQEEYEVKLKEHMKDAAKMIANTKFVNLSIMEYPQWTELLEAVANFSRNGYKITYWLPNESCPEIEGIAEPLVEGETQSVVIITGPREVKLPELNCHHYHLIRFTSPLSVEYIQL